MTSALPRREAPEMRPVRGQRSSAAVMVVLASLGLLASLAVAIDCVRYLDPDPNTPPPFMPDAWAASFLENEALIPAVFVAVSGFAALVTFGAIALAGTAVPTWLWVVQALVVFAAGLFVVRLVVERAADWSGVNPVEMTIWAATFATLAVAMWQAISARRGAPVRAKSEVDGD